MAEIATFVPFSAPMVLPIRVAAGEVAAGAVVLSVFIVQASIVGAMWLAGRVTPAGRSTSGASSRCGRRCGRKKRHA